MSGPKSGSWRVIQMPESEARASRLHAMQQLKYYLECILSFREKLDRLLKEHPELQIHYDIDRIFEPSSEDAAQIVAELNNRYEIYIRLRDEVNRAEGQLKLREQMAAVFNQAISTQQTSTHSLERSTATQLRVLHEKAQEAFASLHEQTSSDRLIEINGALKRCLEAGDMPTSELLLTDLRVRIRRANQETRAILMQQARRRDEDAREAKRLFERLVSSNASDTESLYEKLKKVLMGETYLTDDIRQAVNTAVANSERHYAGKVLRETLELLGNEVTEGFETLFANGGAGYFQRASWEEHHVRVTVDQNSHRLSLALVRYDEGDDERMDQAIRDLEMEETWCGELEGTMNTLLSKGMEIELERRFAPGERSVQVVKDETLKPIHAKRKKSTLRSKSQ